MKRSTLRTTLVFTAITAANLVTFGTVRLATGHGVTTGLILGGIGLTASCYLLASGWPKVEG